MNVVHMFNNKNKKLENKTKIKSQNNLVPMAFSADVRRLGNELDHETTQ